MSDCLFVHQHSIENAEQVEPFFLASKLRSVNPTLKFRYLQKLAYIPLELCLNLADISAFLPWHIDRYKCCQLSSTEDRQQFITPSVHLCLQHDGHDAVIAKNCTYSAIRSIITNFCTKYMPYFRDISSNSYSCNRKWQTIFIFTLTVLSTTVYILYCIVLCFYTWYFVLYMAIRPLWLQGC